MKELKSIYDCKGMKKGDWFKVGSSEFEIQNINDTCANLTRFNHSGYNETFIRFAEREKFANI